MKVEITRIGSNWAGKKFKAEEITDFVEGLNWMKKHGYKAFHAYNGKLSGKRNILFAKDGCTTQYRMCIEG